MNDFEVMRTNMNFEECVHSWSLYTHSNNVFTIYGFKSFQISFNFYRFVSLITVKSINIKYSV